MAHPDIFMATFLAENTRFQPEKTVQEQVDAVIRLYFNHPSLNGYSRIRTWPEYYNQETGKFDSLLAGFIGDTYHPGEIVMSSQTGFIRLIQPFQEESGIWRWEGLTVSRDQEGQYSAEMVNRYYQYENREAKLVPKPVVRFPLRPQQVLDEAVKAYDSFRVRYDLVA